MIWILFFGSWAPIANGCKVSVHCGISLRTMLLRVPPNDVWTDAPMWKPAPILRQSCIWPVDVITTDMRLEGRRKALEEGPYGRCVYYCDNDVVDRQVVNLEFENGSVATFTMTGLSADFCRQLKIFGTKGQIQANMGTREILLHRFGEEPKAIPVDMGLEASGHGGGDYGIIADFLKVLREGGECRTSADISLQSHLICFAAERSRKEHIVVEL